MIPILSGDRAFSLALPGFPLARDALHSLWQTEGAYGLSPLPGGSAGIDPYSGQRSPPAPAHGGRGKGGKRTG